jgi:hypothetical protein
VRKECVERQLSFKSRSHQGFAILVEDLKKRILAHGSKWQSWQHNWREVNLEKMSLPASFEIAIKMMRREERDDVCQRLSSKFKSHGLNQNLVITESKFDHHPRAFAPTSSHEAVHDIQKAVHDIREVVHDIQEAVHDSGKDVKILVKSSMQTLPRFYLFTTKGFKQSLVAKLLQGMIVVQLHLLCECRTGLHKVEGKEGCEVIIEDKKWEEIHAVILEGLKSVVPAINAGLHMTMGLGNIIPNPAEVCSNVIRTNFIGSVQDWVSFTQDQLQMGVSVKKEAAEQWLVNFLSTKDILKDFGLERVLYLDNQGQRTGEMAWLCEEHLSQGEQEKRVVRFPHRP